MDAKTILKGTAAEGLALTADPVGSLRLRGPRDARARWLPVVREHKPELLRLLAAPAQIADPNPLELPAEIEATLDRWLDRIDETDPSIRAELLSNCRRNPAGLPGILRLAAEAGIRADSPSPEPAPEPVTCGTCGHFEPDRNGDGSGLGRCRSNAPASDKPPALWPNAQHHCPEWSRPA